MKKNYGWLLFLGLFFSLQEANALRQAAVSQYDALVITLKKTDAQIDTINASGEKKTKLQKLKQSLREFLGITSQPATIAEEKPQVVQPEQDEESDQVVVPSAVAPVDSDKEDEDEDEDDGSKALSVPQSNSTPTSKTPAATKTPINLDPDVPYKARDSKKNDGASKPQDATPVKKPVVTPVHDASGDDANELVDAYYDANLAFQIADKKNPIFISPAAGAADRAARKAYEDAKAKLALAKTMYTNWLAKTTVSSSDFIAVKKTITDMINSLQTPYENAKKNNPLVAATATQKANRATFDKLDSELKMANSILNDLNKKSGGQSSSPTQPSKSAPVAVPTSKVSSDDANELVEAYYEATVAFAVADKKNPMFISPAAGAADRAARKAYEDAKKHLDNCKKAYTAWLTQTSTESRDYIMVKQTVTDMIGSLQAPYAEAKKNRSLVVVTDSQKAKEAVFTKLDRELKAAQAILNDLNKK